MAYYNSLLYFCILFFVFIFNTIITEGIGQVPAVIVFGDSLVDVGNNNHLELSILKSNYPYNGIDYANHKPTGRYSNGKNAADFFAENLGLATSPPYLSIRRAPNKVDVLLNQGGINFASGGAGILNETNKLFKQSISLNEQIAYFKTVHGELMQQLGTVQAQTYLAKSVFLITIGSNDILDKFQGLGVSILRTEPAGDQFINSLVVIMRSKLKTIYHLGARKFAVVGLGLIGCCPKLRSDNHTGECNEQANYWSVKYNRAVKSLLQELKEELTDIHYSLLNTYDIMVDFLQQPALYGFTETESACCGGGEFRAQIPCIAPLAVCCRNRRNHIFWDLYHPTEAASRHIINEFFTGSEKYAYPANLKNLLQI
ncbi:hypothetical protein MKW94_029721 [Papaver nudicaule]|uniref:GDSL esterase/lipase n=1 Tax=Papaver nudicaule TaxID=74823 RepID=A0AA41W164_PAPNU|nr:hypothetical protein [Papaver nudicaule]